LVLRADHIAFHAAQTSFRRNWTWPTPSEFPIFSPVFSPLTAIPNVDSRYLRTEEQSIWLGIGSKEFRGLNVLSGVATSPCEARYRKEAGSEMALLF